MPANVQMRWPNEVILEVPDGLSVLVSKEEHSSVSRGSRRRILSALSPVLSSVSWASGPSAVRTGRQSNMVFGLQISVDEEAVSPMSDKV